MATRRITSRFNPASDPMLPRSSSSSGYSKDKNNGNGILRYLLLLGLLATAVFVVTRISKNIARNGLSTGVGGEHDEYAKHWGHHDHHFDDHHHRNDAHQPAHSEDHSHFDTALHDHHHDNHHDQYFSHDHYDNPHGEHQYNTGRSHHIQEHHHRQQHHDHAAHGHAPADDGSLIVNTAGHHAAGAAAGYEHAGLPPAHTVGGDGHNSPATVADHAAHAPAAWQGQNHGAVVQPPATQLPYDLQLHPHDQQQQQQHFDQHHYHHQQADQHQHHDQHQQPHQQQQHHDHQQQDLDHQQQDLDHQQQPDHHLQHGSEILPEWSSDGTPASQHHHEDHALLPDPYATPQGLYTLSAIDIDGNEVQLSKYAGKISLVVNVASHCGYTDSNYKGLQEAYNKYHQHGLEILAFPCNQFGNQEPGTDAEVKSWAHQHYNVAFPLFSKVEVNGPHAHPVFKYIQRELPIDQGGGGGTGPGRDFVWNFQKVLINRHGQPVKLLNQDFHQGLVEHAIYDLLVAEQ